MLIYLLLYASIPVLRKVNIVQFIICISIELILILILRHETLNIDYAAYSGGFDFISSLDLKDMISRISIIDYAKLPYPYKFESGWMVLNWIVGKLCFGFRGILFLHAVFCITTVAQFIKKYSDNPWLSLALFVSLGFYSYMFGIMRQTMCMCILLYGIKYIKARKFFKFLLVVYFAFLIHKSAIIFIPLYFLSRIRINRKIFLVICISFGAFIFASKYIFRLLVPILSTLGYSSYLEGSFQWNNMLTLAGIIIPLSVFLCADFAKFFIDNDNNLICWATLLAIPVLAIGAINEVLGRCADYYSIFMILLIPNVINQYHNKKIAYFATGGIYIVCGLLYIYTLVGSRLVPYVSIFG